MCAWRRGMRAKRFWFMDDAREKGFYTALGDVHDAML